MNTVISKQNKVELVVKNIFLFGASGKMGTCVHALIEEGSHFSVTENAEQADSFLDFSTMTILEKNIAMAQKARKPLVIGTTGHGKGVLEVLKEAAKEIPIFFSANFSLGVALSLKALKFLKNNLPEEHRIEISETHNVMKKDAPSGTARLFAHGLDFPYSKIKSARVDETVFSHEVSFSFGNETITLKHEAFSREVFARGALCAMEFILDKTPGLYGMEDLIREKG